MPVWEHADELGIYHRGYVFDHLTPIFTDPGPQLEGWTLLSALAARTTRLRLGVMVSSVTHRPPGLLAKMAATVDQVSDGRLELGLGAGWDAEEHAAFGIPFPPVGERMDRLEEACTMLDRLLRGETVTHHGAHYDLVDAALDPRPVQRPRPPLLIGGRGERRTLRIAARFADHWNCPVSDPEVFAHKRDVLHRHCAAVGRDASEIECSAQVRAAGREPSEVAADVAALDAVGADHVIVWFSAPFSTASLGAVAEAVDSAGVALEPRPATL